MASVEEQLFQWLEKAATPTEDPYKTLAVAVHAILLCHGFRPSEEEPPENVDNWKLQIDNAKIPAQFEENKYGGSYRHYKSCMSFEIRFVPMNKFLVVNANASAMETTVSCELRLEKYLKDTVFQDDKLVFKHSESWRDILKNVQDLMGVLRIQVIYKLVPDSTKEGLETNTRGNTSHSSSSETHARSYQPEREDPLRIGPPLRPTYSNVYDDGDYIGFVPPSLGEQDLYPGALPRLDRMPHTPFNGSFARPEGGSLMGPRHPMFQQGNNSSRRDDLLPRSAVPPGARFDEFGPRFPPDQTYHRPQRPPSQEFPDHDEPPPPEMYM
eukprot:jgi/Galph1/5421/GphlegSOOS_G4037.1